MRPFNEVEIDSYQSLKNCLDRNQDKRSRPKNARTVVVADPGLSNHSLSIFTNPEPLAAVFAPQNCDDRKSFFKAP